MRNQHGCSGLENGSCILTHTMEMKRNWWMDVKAIRTLRTFMKPWQALESVPASSAVRACVRPAGGEEGEGRIRQRVRGGDEDKQCPLSGFGYITEDTSVSQHVNWQLAKSYSIKLKFQTFKIKSIGLSHEHNKVRGRALIRQPWQLTYNK